MNRDRICLIHHLISGIEHNAWHIADAQKYGTHDGLKAAERSQCSSGIRGLFRPGSLYCRGIAGADADTAGTSIHLCRGDRVCSPASGSSCKNVLMGRRVFLQQRLGAGRHKASVQIPRACLAQGQLECFAWEPPEEGF